MHGVPGDIATNPCESCRQHVHSRQFAMTGSYRGLANRDVCVRLPNFAPSTSAKNDVCANLHGLPRT